MKKIILFLFLLFKALASFSQLNQVEASSGFHKSGISHFSILPASDKLGLSINTLAFFQKYHRQQDVYLDEAGFKFMLLKKITPTLSIGPELYYNSFAGMMEKLIINYAKMGQNYHVIIVPSVGYSNKETAVISELYFDLQYKKPLGPSWQLLAYVQSLNNWIKLQSVEITQTHNRSFQKIRVGLSKDAKGEFGLALDFDQYGPDPIYTFTPGIFLRKVIIHN